MFVVVCVSACGDCHGVDCENCEVEIETDSDDEDGNIFDVFEDRKILSTPE